ncbi:MAG: MBL fold metallo-hydrolase [Acidimicrobiia bacterium]|nr:MBL fold metallo-hydrolase [Acidimicrobiia bacterium]
MKRFAILAVLVAVAAAGAVFGQAPQGGRQGGPPPAMLTIEQVKPGLYAILNPGANTLAVRVTSEGVLIVDDMFERNYEDIIRLVKTVTDQPVKYVVSTHHHGDHTGGNAKMLQHATIVGHKNARAAMVKGNQPGPPPVTYANEAAIHLGGAEVQLHHVGRGHTNGDTIVYFPDLRVMATGDLFVVLPRVPAIDYTNGGTSLEWLTTIDNIMKFDFDVVVPGHGPVSKKEDLARFKQRFMTVQSRTRELIRKGVPKDQYLKQLKVDDLGWELVPGPFVNNAAGPFYDEMSRN